MSHWYSTSVSLLDTVAYPTRNDKVFAARFPISLSPSLGYATLLNLLPSSPNNITQPLENDKDLVMVLPTSTSILYIDGSFFKTPPSMASAWMALDDDGLILKSSSDCLPSIYSAAMHVELYALLLAIKAFPPNSSATDYLLRTHNLSIALVKVLTHDEDLLNNHVDVLAKSVHSSSQPSTTPMALLRSPDLFNWAGIYFWLSQMKEFASHKNGCAGL
ncbi:hypothetical protein RhiirA4_479375 [Rhizophagus irregularis]|uniref:RNase H type-1 domain-containing protein n=1 Tax=Rhizophagus irregularis TaxID=588596 RepID=A0A2I1HGD3_9GLOM|nr:hypothetical protein RhiirA4_479375 [Rhizophagus irregularis]